MRYHRRTAPKVIAGKVQRQNRTRAEPDYTATHQIRIERRKPRPGYRHFVSPTDVHAFLSLLPEWNTLAIGLQRVLLDNDTSCYGWCSPNTVALCAWEDQQTHLTDPGFFADHAATFARLRVPARRVVLVWECLHCGVLPTEIAREDEPVRLCINCVRCEVQQCDIGREELESFYRERRLPREDGGAEAYLVEWTDDTIQAFQLIHVLVHELGHHHDRMTSLRQRDFARGERYAEDYALRHEAAIWAAYKRVFRIR